VFGLVVVMSPVQSDEDGLDRVLVLTEVTL
jgi:hypothetical protein